MAPKATIEQGAPGVPVCFLCLLFNLRFLLLVLEDIHSELAVVPVVVLGPGLWPLGVRGQHLDQIGTWRGPTKESVGVCWGRLTLTGMLPTPPPPIHLVC